MIFATVILSFTCFACLMCPPSEKACNNVETNLPAGHGGESRQPEFKMLKHTKCDISYRSYRLCIFCLARPVNLCPSIVLPKGEELLGHCLSAAKRSLNRCQHLSTSVNIPQQIQTLVPKCHKTSTVNEKMDWFAERKGKIGLF